MDSFSPMVAVFSTRASLTVAPSKGVANSASISSPSLPPCKSEARATPLTASTKEVKVSFFATKSVSEFTSITQAVLPSAEIAARATPSAAIRLAFFSALACPFFLRNSTAASISPFVSFRAFLQSIIPAPVISRSSFTIDAVIAIFLSSLLN